MCTLSFLPEKDGYFAAMNRDEQRNRATAFPPAIHHKGGLTLLYPHESGGGTWFGGNSRGNLLALLNWYSMQKGKFGEKSRSRGEIIPFALQATNAENTSRALERFNFVGIYPFRLFGFFPAARQIREWRWDAEALATIVHPWSRHHWFSSSWSDKRAAGQRGNACELAWREDLQDPAAWLRELHASHIPEPGPYSICVHRQDAATVSYTEARWAHGGLQMGYRKGNPCQSLESPGIWTLPTAENLPKLG